MAVTKHRQRILDVLREWFRTHDYSPTLEELCCELGRSPKRRATVQRWLQTMRGIDVEWEDNMPRSLRLLEPEPTIDANLLPVKDILRYLATGLAQWEERTDETEIIPEALRLGLSQVYLKSLLAQDDTAPQNLPELFAWAERPLAEWQPSSELKYLSDEACLIEDDLLSDFALEWRVDGRDTEHQVQETVLLEVLRHCRQYQEDEAYRAFRKLIITQPVLTYREYRQQCSEWRSLRELIQQAYIDLSELQAGSEYHRCPRCGYPQRQRAEGTYGCRSPECDRLSIEQNCIPRSPISAEDADNYKVVTPGIHRYGTIPGLWEIELQRQLSQLGVSVTLWPEIDEYDLLVDFGRKQRWAIDVKDWRYLNVERLKQVRHRTDVKETYVVFPDANERLLRLEAQRDRLEAELGGLRLCLMSELLKETKKQVGGQPNA